MSYVYETRNGQRVETHVAQAFDRMNAAFKAATGQSLIVSSGTRTEAEQEAIFRARYVTAGNVRGRKVYDTRSWQGQLWYRISNLGTVAIPTPPMSNHQEDGPNGPRSIDIRDTGADAGVMTRNSARDKWMAAHAGEFGFANEGYNFGEPWHKTYSGALADAPTPPASGGASGNPKFDQNVYNRQVFLNKHRNAGLKEDGEFGPLTKTAIKNYQAELQAKGLYKGALDGDWGPATELAHQKNVAGPAQNSQHGHVGTVADLASLGNTRGLQKIAQRNGYPGKVDNVFKGGSQAGLQNFLNSNYGGSLAAWLRAKWGYADRDDLWGPNMLAAVVRANAANDKALKAVR